MPHRTARELETGPGQRHDHRPDVLPSRGFSITEQDRECYEKEHREALDQLTEELLQGA
ncbi:hypothetical protein ACGFJT_37470 [Actinomadura geliboluensis]|uniref:hypothetical protein n=1 Tax=Actinomadura geliboluensis TaxID=882440 RepID=UPI00371B4D83